MRIYGHPNMVEMVWTYNQISTAYHFLGKLIVQSDIISVNLIFVSKQIQFSHVKRGERDLV